MIDWAKYNEMIYARLGEQMEYRPIVGQPITDARVIPEWDVELFGDYGNVIDLTTFFNVIYPDIQPKRGEYFRYQNEDYEVIKQSEINDQTRRRVRVKKVIRNG